MKEPLKPHPSISRACGSVHVGENTLSAMRSVIRQVWKSFARFQMEKPHIRRWVIASVALCHAQNRLQYEQVMGGNYGKLRGQEIVNPYTFDTATNRTERIAKS